MNEIKPEYERVIDYIYAKIVEGELVVGSKLPTERSLAESMGISRNSAREALSILCGMGIVERVQGSGNYITKNASNAVRNMLSMTLALGRITESNIIDFRRAVERSLCIEIIKKGLTKDEIANFENILKNMKSEDIEQRIYWDEQFHAALFNATGNPLFVTLLGVITNEYLGEIRRVGEKLNEDVREELFKIHAGIYHGLLYKKADEAILNIEKHFDLVNMVLN